MYLIEIESSDKIIAYSIPLFVYNSFYELDENLRTKFLGYKNYEEKGSEYYDNGYLSLCNIIDTNLKTIELKDLDLETYIINLSNIIKSAKNQFYYMIISSKGINTNDLIFDLNDNEPETFKFYSNKFITLKYGTNTVQINDIYNYNKVHSIAQFGISSFLSNLTNTQYEKIYKNKPSDFPIYLVSNQSVGVMVTDNGNETINKNKLDKLNNHLSEILKCQTKLAALQNNIFSGENGMSYYKPNANTFNYFCVIYNRNQENIPNSKRYTLFHRMKIAHNEHRCGLVINTVYINCTLITDFIHQCPSDDDKLQSYTDAEYVDIKIDIDAQNNKKACVYYSGNFNTKPIKNTTDTTINIKHYDIDNINDIGCLENILKSKVIVCCPKDERESFKFNPGYNKLLTYRLSFTEFDLIGYETYDAFRIAHCTKVEYNNA